LLGWYFLLGAALPLTLRAEFAIEDKFTTQMRKNREADPVVKPPRENTFRGKSSHAADPALTEILIRCSQAGGLFHNYQPTRLSHFTRTAAGRLQEVVPGTCNRFFCLSSRSTSSLFETKTSR